MGTHHIYSLNNSRFDSDGFFFFCSLFLILNFGITNILMLQQSGALFWLKINKFKLM